MSGWNLNLIQWQNECLEPESFCTPPKTSTIATLYDEIIKKNFTNKNAIFSSFTFVNKKSFMYI